MSEASGQMLGILECIFTLRFPVNCLLAVSMLPVATSCLYYLLSNSNSHVHVALSGKTPEFGGAVEAGGQEGEPSTHSDAAG